MTFQLDTSGRVVTEVSEAFETYHEWSDLSPFTQGYIEALFASANETLSYNPAHPFRANGFSDLAPETLARIIADCEAAATVRGSDGYEATGREFWMVRQAGMIVAFPPLTVQLGDDGKVRFAEPARSSEGEGAQ